MEEFLESLQTPFQEGFGMVFGLVLYDLCKMLCVAQRGKVHCFVLVFIMFRAHRPCHKNPKEEKRLVVLVYVFREGSWHHFSWIWGPFWMHVGKSLG